MLVAESAGVNLLQGKLRIGFLTWRSAVQERNVARQSLRRAGGRWGHRSKPG